MIGNPYKGKFIVFEGLDLSGKTTTAKRLKSALEQKGFGVLLTKEPTETSVFGKLVRKIYQCESVHTAIKDCLSSEEFLLVKQLIGETQKHHLDHFENMAQKIISGDEKKVLLLLQLGMIFDREYHLVSEVIPALGEGKFVISDRYFLSTLAYGSSEGLDWKWLLKVHEEVFGEKFLKPDLLLVLDVSSEEAMRRKEASGRKTDYFETKDRLEKIRKAYLDIGDELGFTNVIDGERLPEEVLTDILREVGGLMS